MLQSDDKFAIIMTCSFFGSLIFVISLTSIIQCFITPQQVVHEPVVELEDVYKV